MYYGLRSEEENVNWLEFAHEFKRKIGEKISKQNRDVYRGPMCVLSYCKF